MLLINEINQLYLGNQGENGVRTIQIDMSAWMVGDPVGQVSLWHKRNGDAVPGPTGATYDPETKIMSWTPDNTDTYVSGEGQAEIRIAVSKTIPAATEEDEPTTIIEIKKSKIIKTGVSPAVTGSGQPLGSGWQDYIDAIERAAAVAIIKDGQIKFAIDEDSGHLILSYTDQVPIVEEESSDE